MRWAAPAWRTHCANCQQFFLDPFVTGLLEAYWEAYEAEGLNLFADYDYLRQVWYYHQQMVEAICAGNYDQGHQALVAHKDLLFQRPASAVAARR